MARLLRCGQGSVLSMRLGVLDVGSNTVHLLVVDAYQGAPPMPAFSHKTVLKLADHLQDGISLSGRGEHSLREVVEEALRIAEDWPGSPGRLRPARAPTSSACSGTPT
jgi:hypothetical protein